MRPRHDVTIHTLIMSIIPAIVGICAMTVLDAQLGNITRDQFERIFKNQWLRGLTLFGGAYAANGGRIFPAAFAVYVYFSLVNDSFKEAGDSTDTLLDPHHEDKADTKRDDWDILSRDNIEVSFESL
tara:strand:+ start:294 stop:674 length:381 start_codon:yes stop_codon:yes gene_type:complete